MHCRQHIVLCLCCGHHCPHGIELNSHWKTKGMANTMEKQSNFWITLQQTLTRPYNTASPTWPWMRIWTRLTCLNQTLAVALADIFSWVSLQKSVTPKIEWGLLTLCTILWLVIASAPEAELGAPFLNCKKGMIFCLTLEELGHLPPKIQIHCNNATTVGIANNTVKRQHSQSMEMRYFWMCDKIAQNAFGVKWHPGQENLADYQSKHHPGTHHQAIRPWYLHTKYSPMVFPRATRPSTLKGFVGTLPEGYIRNVPLPWDPRVQSTKSRVQVHVIPDCYKTTYFVPTYSSPSSIVESAAYAFSPAWHAIAINI